MRAPYEWQPETAALRALLDRHQRLVLAPRMGCGSVGGPYLVAEDLVLVASERTIPVNTMWAARTTRPVVCGDEGYAALQDNELRVFQPGLASGPLAMPDFGRQCGQIGRVSVCSTGRGEVANLPPVPVPAIATGLRIPVDPNSPNEPLVWGWGMPGPGGAWSDGHSATIAGRLTAVPDGRAELTLWGWAFPGNATGRRRIIAFFNEHKIAEWNVVAGTPVELHVKLPADANLAAPFAIRLNFPETVSPAAFGMSDNHHRLGFMLSAYRIGVAEAE